MQEKCSYSIDVKYKSLETEKHQLQPETGKKTPQIFQNQSPYSVTQPCLVMFVNILA